MQSFSLAKKLPFSKHPLKTSFSRLIPNLSKNVCFKNQKNVFHDYNFGLTCYNLKRYSQSIGTSSIEQQYINRYWRSVFKGETEKIPKHKLKVIQTEDEMREMIDRIVSQHKIQSALGKYETVHTVRSLEDIKRRLGPERRCFGFFHKNAPLEPLVFVWVALTKGISKSIQGILEDDSLNVHDEAHTANTAIFYSINSQTGVSGVDLGNFLIKRVVSVLQNELPNIETFCTLSPLPNFASWVNKWLTPEIRKNPDLEISKEEENGILSLEPNETVWTEALKKILDARGWISNEEKRDILKPVLLKLATRYVLKEKKPNSIYAYDPVTNFHLRNGASVQSLNWLGDTSYNGVRTSYGIMCNYNYILANIESNNFSYLKRGEIAVSMTGLDPSFNDGIRYVQA
ncbi:hypothetical protein BB559_005142 [Furculomyces boomerangus]|uniref:Malonyl-CoA decarboxylase C-terminal domain-containing protein n=1 Tax=Furculomyces boomerangus TaxID=61424 RepID=A0A2T9YAI5_9FUNG|nr:hypothetical protein BB559_005142 [Furculomyces boomerangus]